MPQATMLKSVMTSVKLDTVIKKKLSDLAAFKNRTPHFLMREAICGYIVRETARQSFITEAQESYEHYQQTGLHITSEEFDSWIQSLPNQNNAIPVCHK